MPQFRILFFLSIISFAFGGMTAALSDKRVISIEGDETAAVLKINLSKDSRVLLSEAEKASKAEAKQAEKTKAKAEEDAAQAVQKAAKAEKSGKKN